MKNFGSSIWGILLIVCGVIVGGNALNFWHISLFFPGWWTLFIIIPALVSIIKNGLGWGNIIWLGIGAVLLFSAWDFFPWKFIWSLALPGFLVVMGIYILFGAKRRRSFRIGAFNGKNASTFCSSAEERVVNQPYEGGKVSAVMGSSVLDLSCALIEHDIEMKVDVFMGSVEIYFPPNVKVVVNSSPFLGAVENKTGQPLAINCPAVQLYCSVALGSIELK